MKFQNACASVIVSTHQKLFFTNPVALPKFITALAVDNPVLKDDTTLIMLKR